MRVHALIILGLLLSTPLLSLAQHEVSTHSTTWCFAAPSRSSPPDLLRDLLTPNRASRLLKDPPPDFFVELIPEFRKPETPKGSEGRRLGFATKRDCLPGGSSQAQGAPEADARSDAPPLIPKWRIYPFHMNPPGEVPQRDECDVYLLVQEYKVWRCPPPSPKISNARFPR